MMTIPNEENTSLNPPIRHSSLKKKKQVRILSPIRSDKEDEHTETQHSEEDSISLTALMIEKGCRTESSGLFNNDNSAEEFESVSWFLPLPDLVSPRRDKTPEQPSGRKKSTKEDSDNNSNSQPRQPRRVRSIDPKTAVDLSPQIPFTQEVRRWNSLDSDDVAPCCYERPALDLEPVTTSKSCQIGKAA